MRPDPDVVLRGVAESLLEDLVPQISTPFGKSDAGMLAGLLLTLSGQVDRLADTLRSENTALAELLVDGAAVVDDPDLARRLRAAPGALETPDIRVSTFQQANDRLRGLLIELHAAVEAIDSAQARAMDERIWAELVESTRRRRTGGAR